MYAEGVTLINLSYEFAIACVSTQQLLDVQVVEVLDDRHLFVQALAASSLQHELSGQLVWLKWFQGA